jgi:RNA polymerase subunit RPABC4/transcription elongation factor Spt4
MNARPCRDCGYMLDRDARGCPQCALNLEAENMIDRIFWRVILPDLLVVAATAAGAFIYLRH